MDRRLTNQGQERKQQLLDCAAVLFAERGYTNTRVVDIVRAAGVAKGLFYWYFENKEALFTELLEHVRTQLRREQRLAIDPSADALVRIAQGTRASVRFMAAKAEFFAIFQIEPLDQQFTSVVRHSTDVHAADSVAHITEGIQAGLIRDDDPRLLSLSVLGLVNSLCHFHRTGRITEPVDDLGDFAARLVIRALAADDDVAAAAERALQVPVTV